MHHEEDKEVRGISPVARYTITAIILAIITSIEVMVLYPPLAAAADTPKVVLLCFLGTCKFILVVALFMHLWNDDPLFTGIFGLGMLIGTGTLVALVALLKVYPPRSDAVTHPPLREIYELREKERSEGADAPAGKQHAYFEQLRLAGVVSA
jgi:hypothetical protein